MMISKKLYILKISSLFCLLMFIVFQCTGCNNQKLSQHSEMKNYKQEEVIEGCQELFTDGFGIYFFAGMESIDNTNELKNMLQDKQHQKAFDKLEKMLMLQTKEDDLEKEISIQNNMAIILTIMGRYKEAEPLLFSLIEKTEESDISERLRTIVYNNCGTALGAIGYLDIFKEYTTKAVNISSNDNMLEYLAIGNNALFAEYLVDDRNTRGGESKDLLSFSFRAREYKNRILQFIEEEENLEQRSPTLESMLNKNLGTIYIIMVKEVNALESFQKALKINRESERDNLLEGEIFSWMGRSYTAFGDYKNALEMYRFSRENYERYDNHYIRIAETYTLQGWTQIMQKNYEEAHKLLQKALEYGEPSSTITGFTYNTVAILLASEGDVAGAQKWYLKSYKIFHERKYENEEVLLNYLQTTYDLLDLGKPEEFQAWLKEQIIQIDLSERQYLN